MTDSRSLILESAEQAQLLIHDLHARDPENETFEQVGLLDGLDEVRDFLEHSEQGCALHHLLYMIHESDISFPLEKVRELHSLAVRLNEPNHYRRDNPKLTEEQKALIHNLP